jgi:hypothetical protein
MGVKSFYGKRPHGLFWAGSPVARGKITISGMHNCINYCGSF